MKEECRLISRMRFRVLLPLFILSPTFACAKEAVAPESSLGPGLHIISGDSFIGTPHTPVPVPLVVEVRDEGNKPLAGVVVLFLERGVHVYREGNLDHDRSTDTTDQLGRAETLAQLETVAGPAAVVIRVPALGFEDTAHYFIEPGPPRKFVIAPSDTAIRLGTGYWLNVKLTDQWGNARPDSIQYDISEGVAFDSGRVIGNEFGRKVLAMSSGALRDTAWVSVIPHGVIAATTGSGSINFALFNTDGTEQRSFLETSQGQSGGGFSDWSPDGAGLVYYASDGPQTMLYATNGDGSPRPVMGLDVSADMWPQYSADGSWIYFSRLRDYGSSQIWRVRPDGSEATILTPDTVGGHRYWPSPSPDGRHVVYSRGVEFAWELVILDLETGLSRSLGLEGKYPRWSPRGDMIGYLRHVGYASNALAVVRPDGTGRRDLAGPRGPYDYALGFDWSPDGRWIIAHEQRLVIIDVETGEGMPLHYSFPFKQPAWRP